MAGGRVVLGVVTGAHGVRGEVKLMSFTAEPRAIAGYGPLTTGDGREVRITALRPAGTGFVATLAGIGDRTAAEALRGAELSVARERLPAAAEDEVYHADLIGLAVETVAGARLGRVVGVQNFGAGDLIEIAVPGVAATQFVPFTRAMVPVVDVGGGRLVIDPPDGLIETGAG